MTRLELRVAAVNRANACANKLYNLLAPVFAKFVGQKILTKEGRLMAKVANALPMLPDTPEVRCYHRTDAKFNVCYVIRTCEHDCDNCVYHEVGFYIGDLEDGVLTKMLDHGLLRSDWTAAEVLAGRQRIAQAKKTLSEAQEAIRPFGEYDC